ncbi:MAG TPA: caspase family protein [Kribbella sp.]|uniref:caspase family protein n=1 Tax=Kribbella sp. TaxID=1871183 RepID=UPI002D76BBD7|nr:caspase family protein [Kribbella sp.]HET6295614.1 caspase family protein [Kribbella sp.]
MDGTRTALVIANDQYADPGLRRLVAPAQDAAALADALGDPSVGGFEVTVLQNESAQAIRYAVEDFFADRAPEDLLLLHFSCHGLKNAAGELFLAVADTKPTRLASTAVAADFVNRQMADSRAQRIALFLDCCYGGAFPRGMVVRAAGEAQVRDAFAGQERVGGGRGRVIVTASSAMEYAFEGGQLATDASKPAPSVFTGAVVDGLTTGEADRDGDGWVGLTELVGFVTDRVHRVTPNQNPQMWTFGSQGELLIARSRVRRITPTPLAPELLEAMESPLPATRFGVVDYLRERLDESDLGQAYAAWQALHRMLDDDSRKVSEAASRSIALATPRATPTELDLGTAVEGHAEGELQLEGPPLALTAVASPGAPWIRIEQLGATIRVIASPPTPGPHESSVILTGPTGEHTIPLHLQVPTPTQEPAPEPIPEPPAMAASAAAPTSVPQQTSAPQTETPAPEPSAPPAAVAASLAAPTAVPQQASAPRTEASGPQPQAPAPQVEAPAPQLQAAALQSPTPAGQSPAAAPPAAGSGVVPWWVVGVLAVGALLQIRLNWPGAVDSRKLWYDESNTGWYVYRRWTDPLILASFVALIASLVARWSGRWAPLALGVVLACAVSVIEEGVLVLGAGISYVETTVWTAATAVAAVMSAVILVVLWPKRWPLWPVQGPAAVLVVAGGILLFVSSAIEDGDGVSFFTVTKLAVLEPVLTVGLAWLALAATDAVAGRWLTATAVMYALICVVSTLPALTEGGAAPVFLTALLGNGLIVVAVAFAAPRHFASISREWRPRSRP